MRAILVAHDKAPSMAFEKLFDELAKAEIRVTAYCNHGKTPPHRSFTEIADTIREHADVVLSGMSSSEALAYQEIFAARVAKEAGIPFGFYADTFGCVRREWFREFKDTASFVFTINQREADDAEHLFTHPKRRVVVSGNPEWEEFCFLPYGREEVREKLKIKEDEIFVLSPGHKSPVITAFLWGSVVEALVRSGMNHRKWRVFFSPHPGDSYAPEVYSDLMNYCCLSVCVVPEETMATVNMIPGCDIFINSASTTGIAAHFQRKPVIDYFGEIALMRNETVFGTRMWEPCRVGASLDICGNIQELSRTITLLLQDKNYALRMQKMQERHFPFINERGRTVKIMAETLSGLIKISA